MLKVYNQIGSMHTTFCTVTAINEDKTMDVVVRSDDPLEFDTIST